MRFIKESRKLMAEGDYLKWEIYSKQFKITRGKLLSFRFSANNTLKLLVDKLSFNYSVLDIGCGFAIIDILLAQNTKWQITACDLSDVALHEAKNNVLKENMSDRIKLDKRDVYNLDYPEKSFDMVVSYGYGSAGSYIGVQDQVRKVLKDDGYLVMDFVNHFSIYNIARYPRNTFNSWIRYKKGIRYHFGILGIKKYYNNYGFKMIDKIYMNNFPPFLTEYLPAKLYIIFEKTIGRLLNPILARAIIIKFQKQ